MALKISIVVATYNADAYLERAINSILLNNYPGAELLVIDGGSIDNTVNIIKKYRDNIAYWISEKDKGIYDAWNKGVAKATGDWIMFIGADDILLPNALSDYHEFITALPGGIDYISSKKKMIDINGKEIRVVGAQWEWPYFLKEMMVAHPASLHSKTLFEKYGLYDTIYKITGDYELLLRPREDLKTAFMDKVTIMMSEGGASDSIAAIREHLKAAVKTGGASKFTARINFAIVYTKFKLKKMFRGLGLNIYIKR